MIRCQRCNQETSWTQDMTQLYGGVRAHLCTECITDWSKLFQQELVEETNKLDACSKHYNSLALAKQPVSLSLWEELYSDITELEKRGFTIGKEFVDQVIERPKKVKA